MPVYNAEKYVKQAIESILNQTFQDFEFIILDDGSTDKSVSIVKSFYDSRIRLFENEKKGISYQLNFGISQAKTEFIARMDADDISCSERLRLQYNYLELNPEIDIVGCNSILINLSGKTISKIRYPEKHDDIYNKMPVEQSICHASILAKKTIFQVVTYKSEFEPIEDHKLFLDMLSEGFMFYNIQEHLYKIRSNNHFVNTDKSTLQKKLSYKIGKEFISKNFNKDKYLSGNKNYFYKVAMLEYNNGFMHSSRNYFLRYLKYSNNRMFIILRYILPSLLGDRIFNYLRNNNITIKVNYYFKKIGIETHKY